MAWGSVGAVFIITSTIYYAWHYKNNYTPNTPKAFVDLNVCISQIEYGGSSDFFAYIASTCTSKKVIQYLSSVEIKNDVADYVFPKMNLRYVDDFQNGPPLVVISGAAEILDGDFDTGDAYLRYDKKTKKFNRIRFGKGGEDGYGKTGTTISPPSSIARTNYSPP